MKNSEFTYVVARIKSREAFLLNKTDYDMLINAESVDTIIRFLGDKGWNINSDNIAESLEKELSSVWRLISESISEPQILEALIIENDFHNIKAAVKAIFSDLNPQDFYIRPCSADTDLITYSVKHNDFSNLPFFIKETAENAYNTYVSTSSGQDAEIIIDKSFFNTYREYALKSGSTLLTEIADTKCFLSAVKTALRCVKCGKSDEFTINAIPDFTDIKKEDIFNCVKTGDGYNELLKGTKFDIPPEIFGLTFSEIEKWFDEHIVSLTEKYSWEVFGPDPIISYWIKKQNEIRNIRVIISAKSNGLSQEEIRAKVRGL